MSTIDLSKYGITGWLEPDQLPLRIEGLSLDAVYENFVRQIAGENLAPVGRESLRDSVERDLRRQQLQKQITALENKIRREKQLNRQMELNQHLKILKHEVEQINDENKKG